MVHGTKLVYSGKPGSLPCRSDLVDYNADTLAIKTGKPVDAFFVDLKVEDVDCRCYAFAAAVLDHGLKVVIEMQVNPVFYVRLNDKQVGLNAIGGYEVSESRSQELAEMSINTLSAYLNNISSRSTVNVTMERWKSDNDYQVYKGFYARVKCDALWLRKRMINAMGDYTDGDYTHTLAFESYDYRRLLGMLGLENGGWNRISAYEIRSAATGHDGVVVPVLYVEFEDVVPLDRGLGRDALIECCWDIEAHREADDHKMPDGRLKGDTMFLIGMTFGLYTSDPSLRVVITMYDCEPHDDYLTIVCKEREVSHVMAHLLGRIQPDIMLGFNDSGFDYPFLADKLVLYGDVGQYMRHASLAWKQPWVKPGASANSVLIGNSHHGGPARGKSLVNELIKIKDSWTPVHMLRVFGTVPIDVMIMMRKMLGNPEDSSLNGMLKRYKLPLKNDMPYWRMREIVKNPCAHDMTDVASYCVVDAVSCHSIMAKANVMTWVSALAKKGHVTLHESVYRADGMKVENLLFHISYGMGYMYTMRGMQHRDPSDSYEGGLVLEPKHGVYGPIPKLRDLVEAAGRGDVLPDWSRALDYSAYKELIGNPDLDGVETDIADIVERVYSALPRGSRDEYMQAWKDGVDREVKGHRYESVLRAWFDQKVCHPIFALDYASLYPNIMMNRNLDPTRIIRKPFTSVDMTQAIASSESGVRSARQKLQDAKGYGNTVIAADELRRATDCLKATLRALKIEQEHSGQALRDYERNIELLRESGKTLHHIIIGDLEGYVVRHTYTDPGVYKDEVDPVAHDMGPLPYMLYHLYSERKAVKASMKAAKREAAETGSEEAAFRAKMLDGEQLADKIIMNTSYGKLGDPNSAIHRKLMAAFITMDGRNSLRVAKSWAESHGGEVVYGDTDSIYTMAPGWLFHDVDVKWLRGELSREEYGLECVRAADKCVKEFESGINAAVAEYSGGHYLVMMFEEFLWKAAFFQQKNYKGQPHESVEDVSWAVDNVFMRGGEIVKRGNAEILRKVIRSVIEEILDINEVRSIGTIVRDKIHAMFNAQYPIEDCAYMLKWNAKTQNSVASKFVARMGAMRNGLPIRPGERFPVVNVDIPPKYVDATGKICTLGAHEMIEFPEVVEKTGAKINIAHYLDGKITSELAIAVSIHPSFHVYAGEEPSKRKIKVKKAAESWVKEISGKYIVKHETFGTLHKRYYKEACRRFVPGYAKVGVLGKNAYGDALIDKIKAAAEKAVDKGIRAMDYKLVKDTELFTKGQIYIEVANKTIRVEELRSSINSSFWESREQIVAMMDRLHASMIGKSPDEIEELYRGGFESESLGNPKLAEMVKELSSVVENLVRYKELLIEHNNASKVDHSAIPVGDELSDLGSRMADKGLGF
jgi:DNA polymerase elongation subunit (family B)